MEGMRRLRGTRCGALVGWGLKLRGSPRRDTARETRGHTHTGAAVGGRGLPTHSWLCPPVPSPVWFKFGVWRSQGLPRKANLGALQGD